MSGKLATSRCLPCEGGVPPLEHDEAVALHAQLDSAWDLQPTKLRREFLLDDFREAFSFATKVALLAESEGHHPDLDVRWGFVAVSLTTHAARGLTNNDFVMAAKIDSL